MDLVALIVTALTADRDSAAVQDETRDAVRSAHKRLREAARRLLAGHPSGELALARYEADPQADRAPLERELARAGAGDDPDLVAAALALIELAGRSGKHAVSISGSPGVMVGDNNVQVSYFVQDPTDQRGIGPSAVVAGLSRAAAASVQPTAPPEGPAATREPVLLDHARARKDAARFSGNAPRRRELRTRVGDNVAQEMEALGPDQAALTIEYARHPGYAEKLTVGLARMAPEAAGAALCRVHTR